MTNIKKGQRLRYTGTYAPGVTRAYSDGTAVSFRTGRGIKFVTVELDDGAYADWPIDDVEDAASAVIRDLLKNPSKGDSPMERAIRRVAEGREAENVS